MGPLDPVHQVRRIVRQLAREVYAVGDAEISGRCRIREECTAPAKDLHNRDRDNSLKVEVPYFCQIAVS
jgi:hypothetical protein